MAQATLSTTEYQNKLAQLADFLARASRLARELSQAGPFAPQIPTLTRPNRVPSDEEWFWTDAWQALEDEANAALASGSYKMFTSADDLLADLHRQV